MLILTALGFLEPWGPSSTGCPPVNREALGAPEALCSGEGSAQRLLWRQEAWGWGGGVCSAQEVGGRGEAGAVPFAASSSWAPGGACAGPARPRPRPGSPRAKLAADPEPRPGCRAHSRPCASQLPPLRPHSFIQQTLAEHLNRAEVRDEDPARPRRLSRPAWETLARQAGAQSRRWAMRTERPLGAPGHWHPGDLPGAAPAEFPVRPSILRSCSFIHSLAHPTCLVPVSRHPRVNRPTDTAPRGDPGPRDECRHSTHHPVSGAQL